MMQTQGTPRVERLRQRYLLCPVMVQKLPYSHQLRQRLLFYRGWMQYAHIPTTRLRRAYAEAYVLENMQPIVLDDELLVGQPDLTQLTGEETAALEEFDRFSGLMPAVSGRTDHMSLDFGHLLRVGVLGMIGEIEAQQASLSGNIPEHIAKGEFYEGCLAELRALLALARRYSLCAQRLACTAAEPRASELRQIARVLERVPAHPAASLWEALQSIHFYTFTLWGLYQAGRPDQYLLPYYEGDLRSGALTQAQAQELINCFCLLYSTYIVSRSSIGFMVGGRDRNGVAVENELTRMFLVSIGHTRMADPSIGLCVTDETSDELLSYAVGLLSRGYSHPALYNDPLITGSLLRYGFAPEDAHDYIHSCCVEITACARSAIWTVSPYHNLLQMLLDAMGAHEDAASLDELIDGFAALLRQRVIEGNDRENRWQLERSRNGGEPLRASCLVLDCIRRGKSVDEGGALYNQIQPNFLGLANVVDSLAAIGHLVFETGQMTLGQLNEALRQDYEGRENLRLYLVNKVGHFGNNEARTDALARRIAALVEQSCRGIRTYRGATLIPGAFSYLEHIPHGAATAASPDGRRAGEPLADGSGPVQGHDTHGPTASLLSSTAWDQSPFLGGIAVNLKLLKSQMTDLSREHLLALVKTFMARGGCELQITAVDADELKKAQAAPEKHRDLVVRVGGYSDFFVDLSEAMQNEIIRRSDHTL